MAGEPHEQQAEAFLSRLTGQPVGVGKALSLTSTQKAAFRAWARKEQAPVNLSALSAKLVSLDALLGRAGGGEPSAPPLIAVAWPPPSTGAATAVGVDIEELASMPQASDYREHEFYRENFSDYEIAYCIVQPSPRLSFCGLWAAKEAMVKAGAPGGLGGLRHLEIAHDEAGRPSSPGFSLSISHAGETAIAIALSACGAPPPEPALAVEAEAAPPPAPAVASLNWRQPVAWLAAGLLGGVVGYMLAAVAGT